MQRASRAKTSLTPVRAWKLGSDRLRDSNRHRERVLPKKKPRRPER